ncbi:MAG TPA: aspartate aminotransferase family protein [Flavitalea sp.]|nr:aspartate aminotransferase family protein [Flavitalea sp.]
MNTRELFLQHVAQTSPSPVAIEVVKAKGSILIDADGKEYLDCIAGISVCNLGHGHPKVIKAIKKQLDDYMHVLVYGEMIESPQVAYAKLLTDQLPPYLNSVYFTNSGTEATEGSMKLAKRYTGRPEIICFNKCYHGSTQGALSLIGDEYWRSAFRPLLPGVFHLEYNDFVSIGFVTNQTACVILESVQAEAGVIAPSKEWMIALRDRCTVTGTLLILDEIQTGFGRTGTLWAFEQFGIAPDVLLLGKALGGGMPLGAFIASRSLMEVFTKNPVLGHITTFGGHPVSCAAGLASLKVLLKKNIIAEVDTKQQLFTELLVHPKILDVRANGLLMAVQFENASLAKKIIQACIEEGVLTDWFLFAPQCMRLAPPLTITEKEIRQACKTILAAMDSVQEV